MFLTDLNVIKSDADLATSLCTTFVHVHARAVADMAEVPNRVEPASKFVADATAPELRSFD